MREVRPPRKSATHGYLSTRLGTLLRQIETYQSQVAEQNRQLIETRAELNQSYTRYHELFELAPVGYVVLDARGNIRELNQKAARFLAFAPAWLIDKPFIVFVAPNHIPQFLSYLARAARALEKTSIDLDLLAGSQPLPVRLETQVKTKGGAIQYRMTIIDLSDIKKTEKELQESLESWRSLIQSAPDVIMTVDETGSIRFANRAIWNKTVRALVGKSIFHYVPQQHHPTLRRSLDEAFRLGSTRVCDIEMGNGVPVWFSFCFGPMHRPDSSNGSKKVATLIIREVSEQKRAEKVLRTSSDQLREFSARLEAVREEERTRVAREIHDELGQALTGLRLDLSWLESKTPRDLAETREKMTQMIGQVDEIIRTIRRISSDLRPSILDDLGLIPAIEWQVSEFTKRTGIRCELHSRVQNLELDRERSTAIFRVVQEALTNVLRHAEASRVQIQAGMKGSRLLMTIMDNGKGMSNPNLAAAKSLGLVGMKERILRLGGAVNVWSRPGEGTRLHVSLRIPKKEGHQ